jgi:tetratricopeptide (TPR) repeat protein
MRWYSGGHVHGGGTPNARRVSIVATIIAIVWASVDSNALQGAVSINGTVSLPDGNPAIRVIVTISGLSGLNREVRTDSQGRFDFQGMPAGRYRLTATNPADPSQFTDAVEVDTSRSAVNRLLVHLFLRTQQAKKEPRAGVLSLAEASQQIPKDARKAFEEALRLKADNKIDQALKIFTKAIDFYPSYFQALAERGQLHIAKNQNTEAIADFERAVKLNEVWGPALRGLGYCYLEQQKFEDAAKFLERAVAAEPGVANTHLFFGIASLALDRRDAAKKALQEALRLDSKVAVTAHIYLADLYARQRQFTEAADELRIYLAASPDAPNAARLKAKEAELRARTKR